MERYNESIFPPLSYCKANHNCTSYCPIEGVKIIEYKAYDNLSRLIILQLH